jgi:homoserine kinase type II
MSVFTKVSHSQLREFLRAYPVGRVIGFQGIGEGVENTNYFVDTTDGRFVLTLFERLNHDDLPFFLGLMDHCATRGVPCPKPIAMRDGGWLTELNGKPAALVQRLPGASELFPNVEQCRAAGEVLAELHMAAKSFPTVAENTRGPEWRQATGERLLERVDADIAALIRDELQAQAAIDWAKLPQGVVHADLFRDNVLFTENRVSGLIDFYYACVDAQVYDLAITVNDWCFDVDGNLNLARYNAMLTAYRGLRELSSTEREAWPMMLRAAALRFWLSRLYDWHFPREGDLVHVKDPEQYRRVLCLHREGGAPAL